MICPYAQSPDASFDTSTLEMPISRASAVMCAPVAPPAPINEIAWIVAAFHRHPADCVDHVVVHDGEHPIGRFFHRNPEWISQMGFDRRARFLEIQRQTATHETMALK